MMKIHTTQNLSLLAKDQPTNNTVSQNELSFYRLRKYEQFPEEQNMTSISFKGNKPNSKDVKKIVESAKKIVGDIKKQASPEVKKGDKFLKSSFFNALLKVADYEAVVQSAIAAVICILLRPLTIMALPTKKKEDPDGKLAKQAKTNNIYAASHSIASGTVGFIAVFLLTTPFKKGADYVMKNMIKDLKDSTLKRLYPQLDLKSIVNKSGERVAPVTKEIVDGKKVETFNWKNIDGNRFSSEIKDVDKLPSFKQLADMSEETFNNILGVNVDWAAQKGKSFNDIVTKDGKKMYDVIDFSKLGIKVSHTEKPAHGKEILSEGQILFKDIDREYLQELVNNADEKSLLKGLDVNSAFDANNKIVDFRKWKDIHGQQWKLDLDAVYASSPLETADYAPRITGRMRFDKKEGIHKFRTYQKNAEGGSGLEGNLGTEISDEMLQAEKSNVGLFKALTWLPDLAFRVPIAVGTIALIPWVLKNVFHVEKQKSTPVEEKPVAQQVKPEPEKENTQNVSFKGKGGSGKGPSWFTKKMAEWYGKPLIESEKAHSIASKLADLPGEITQHMSTLGSLITSGVYVMRTLSNKDMDPDRKKTLAINQTLCFFVPTIAAYTVDSLIRNKVKSIEYRYAGLQENAAAVAKAHGQDAKAITESLGNKIKGVRILAGLATFTLIYRYITPVLITPIANMIGDKLIANNKAKKEAQNTDKVA